MHSSCFRWVLIIMKREMFSWMLNMNVKMQRSFRLLQYLQVLSLIFFNHEILASLFKHNTWVDRGFLGAKFSTRNYKIAHIKFWILRSDTSCWGVRLSLDSFTRHHSIGTLIVGNSEQGSCWPITSMRWHIRCDAGIPH